MNDKMKPIKQRWGIPLIILFSCGFCYSIINFIKDKRFLDLSFSLSYIAGIGCLLLMERGFRLGRFPPIVVSTLYGMIYWAIMLVLGIFLSPQPKEEVKSIFIGIGAFCVSVIIGVLCWFRRTGRENDADET
jgi:hypothetical protein